jgi:drug/metabolite transporter (DMT)-like permease
VMTMAMAMAPRATTMRRAVRPTVRASGTAVTRRVERARAVVRARSSTSRVEETASEAATRGDGGVECVASTMGAECVMAEPETVDATSREVECVGVGMEASCDVSGTFDAGDERARATEDAEDDALAGALGSLALISPFFLWGTSMVAMKEVLPVTSPMFVATVRLVPAGLILVAWALSKGRPMPKSAAAWGAIAAFALVDATMFQGFLAEGLQRTAAGLGSVIIDSQPLTVAILASILFGETLGAEGVAGLVLGVLGLLLLELPEEALTSLVNGDAGEGLNALQLEGSIWDSGEWWMLLAAQSMAVGTVMVRWVCKYVDPVMATGWHMVLGGVPLMAYSLATESDMYANLALSAGDVASLTYASVFGGAVAYGAFFYFATKGSLTKLSSLTFLTPMFASALGYVALDETLTAAQLGGAVVTLVGIYFVNTRAQVAASED